MDQLFSIRNQRCPNLVCGSRNAHNYRILIHGQKRKRFKCRECGMTWSASRGTPMYGLRSDAGKIRDAIVLMRRGMSIRKIAAQVGVGKNTVARWAKRINYKDFYPPTRE